MSCIYFNKVALTLKFNLNSAPAIYARGSYAKLDAGSTAPSLRRQAPDANIRRIIHRNLHNVVLVLYELRNRKF